MRAISHDGSVPLRVRVPKGFRAVLVSYARARKTSVSELVREAILEKLAKAGYSVVPFKGTMLRLEQ